MKKLAMYNLKYNTEINRFQSSKNQLKSIIDQLNGMTPEKRIENYNRLSDVTKKYVILTSR